MSLVPDRDGDGARDVAVVFATFPERQGPRGTLVLCSGRTGVLLSRLALDELEPDRIVWIGPGADTESLLGVWLTPGEGTSDGSLARLVLEGPTRVTLVDIEALDTDRLGWDATGAFAPASGAGLVIVDRTSREQMGRLRVVDRNDGRELARCTGEQLRLAFDGVRGSETGADADGRWLLLSRRENKLAITDRAWGMQLVWSVPELVNAVWTPDLDGDRVRDVVAVQLESQQVEHLVAYSGANGTELWRQPHRDLFSSFGASLDVSWARGGGVQLAVSSPNTFFDPQHGDAGRIDVLELASRTRKAVFEGADELDYLGGRVLWGDRDAIAEVRMLFATALDPACHEALVRAYVVRGE
ncbi:MAG: hypothetical protein IT453_22070 [Planctomycetes bacterium]|nr:hypothetical protein [Planctomycetota bacterium]